MGRGHGVPPELAVFIALHVKIAPTVRPALGAPGMSDLDRKYYRGVGVGFSDANTNTAYFDKTMITSF